MLPYCLPAFIMCMDLPLCLNMNIRCFRLYRCCKSVVCSYQGVVDGWPEHSQDGLDVLRPAVQKLPLFWSTSWSRRVRYYSRVYSKHNSGLLKGVAWTIKLRLLRHRGIRGTNPAVLGCYQ